MGTQTWKVRLVKGKTYRFVCDPHSDEMFGASPSVPTLLGVTGGVGLQPARVRPSLARGA